MDELIERTRQIYDEIPVFPDDEPVKLDHTKTLEEDGHNHSFI